ncbi:30S ribosome-binding factor RbfA [Phenylobacterium sp. LH3H17]|uniref:30S ribosome-binding factor RbfA n=1 Tax=Phenylobacterium sp. LH3H17 TaxID=2903901 RepID=UPI0020C9CBE7|nr:30S ribosome-binding factor RbfA [Phenylobacterium sp. LH3H17]UTP39607.1 30S ribosome-binding factor RbfA [Phenylobacterium sp. LH3H17]
MKKNNAPRPRGVAAGPTQRQLRAGELMRHALVEIMRTSDFTDVDLADRSVTVTEVRMSPDLRHAVCFVEPLGGIDAEKVVAAMNRHTKFIRGQLGRRIDMKFTPDLKFLHDESFNEATRIGALFDNPKVRQDLTPDAPSDSWKDED